MLLINNNFIGMKSISFNIRFLTWVLIVATIFMIIARVWNKVIFLASDSEFRLLGISIPPQIGPTMYKSVVGLYCLSLTFLIYHLNTFRKVMTDFYNDLIFSYKNGLQLRQIANGVLYFAIFMAIFKIILGVYSSNPLNVITIDHSEVYNHGLTHNHQAYLFGYNIGRTIWIFLPILIISQVISLVSEMIKKGQILKSENDLTI